MQTHKIVDEDSEFKGFGDSHCAGNIAALFLYQYTYTEDYVEKYSEDNSSEIEQFKEVSLFSIKDKRIVNNENMRNKKLLHIIEELDCKSHIRLIIKGIYKTLDYLINLKKGNKLTGILKKFIIKNSFIHIIKYAHVKSNCNRELLIILDKSCKNVINDILKDIKKSMNKIVIMVYKKIWNKFIYRLNNYENYNNIQKGIFKLVAISNYRKRVYFREFNKTINIVCGMKKISMIHYKNYLKSFITNAKELSIKRINTKNGTKIIFELIKNKYRKLFTYIKHNIEVEYIVNKLKEMQEQNMKVQLSQQHHIEDKENDIKKLKDNIIKLQVNTRNTSMKHFFLILSRICNEVLKTHFRYFNDLWMNKSNFILYDRSTSNK